MSKNFQEEYKEYLKAEAPDLWDRIEAGVDAYEADKKIVPMKNGKYQKVKKKKQIRYQNYRAIVSVAACLFALLLVVPVYLLVKPVGKGDGATADSAAPMVLMDATIENIEVPSEETAMVTEESAPAQEQVEETASETIEIEAETDMDGIQMEMAQVMQEEEEIPQEEYSTEGTDLAKPEVNDKLLVDENVIISEEEQALEETADEGAAVEETAEEETSVPVQEDMEISVLAEGVQQGNGMMYRAEVAGSASAATLSLFVPADMGIILEAEKTYRVTVEMSEDGSYYVVIEVTE